jgi:DNA-binding transcriptional MerR regulator
MNASRQVGDFLVGVDRLGERERGALRDLGVSVEPIRQVLEAEGFSFERKRMLRPGMPPLDQRLEAIRQELAKIEAALQGSPRVYR